MSAESRLTDELLRDMLERRSRRGTADGLREAILASTQTARQRSGRRTMFGGGRALRLLAIAALIGGAVAAGLFIAGQRPPVPMLSFGFVRSFLYPDLPGTGFGKPVDLGYLVAFPSDGGLEAYPSDQTADGTSVIRPGSHGIAIASIDDAVTHPCPLRDGQSSRIPFREDPAGSLEDFEAVSGAGIGEVKAITFDGRPALTADIDPLAGRCDYADLHVHGSSGIGQGYMRLSVPSRLIVTEVHGMTMVLQIWAATREDLDAWLPTATDFLDHLHFKEFGEPGLASPEGGAGG